MHVENRATSMPIEGTSRWIVFLCTIRLKSDPARHFVPKSETFSSEFPQFPDLSDLLRKCQQPYIGRELAYRNHVWGALLASKNILFVLVLVASELIFSHRIRRIRCDEQKLECNRSSATGRKCDGYINFLPGRVPPARKRELNSTRHLSSTPKDHISLHIDT